MSDLVQVKLEELGKFLEAHPEAAREAAALALGFVDPAKPYGTDLFNGLNRLSPHVAVEVVCIRKHPTTCKLQVWLRLRGPNEAYPNHHEVGGSTIQNGEDVGAVVRRLSESKFKSRFQNFIALPEAAFFHPEERGWYWHVVVAGFFEQDPPDRPEEGTGWFDIDDLPRNTCKHHRRMIDAAVNYFLHREIYDAATYLSDAVVTGVITSIGEQIAMSHAAAILRAVPGKILGPMYSAIAPRVTFDSHELGIYRRAGGKLQWYMVRRDALNPRFPREWHFPGLQQLPGEDDADTIRRAMQVTYNLPLRGEAIFICRFPPPKKNLEREPGGAHINAHLWLVIGDNSHLPVNETHGWFEIGKLPDLTVYSHREDLAPRFGAALSRYDSGDRVAEPRILDLFRLL